MHHLDVIKRTPTALIVALAATVLLLVFPGCNVSNCCHCTCDGDDCSGETDVSSSELMDCTSECQTQCATMGCPFESGEPC